MASAQELQFQLWFNDENESLFQVTASPLLQLSWAAGRGATVGEGQLGLPLVLQAGAGDGGRAGGDRDPVGLGDSEC